MRALFFILLLVIVNFTITQKENKIRNSSMKKAKNLKYCRKPGASIRIKKSHQAREYMRLFIILAFPPNVCCHGCYLLALMQMY